MPMGSAPSILALTRPCFARRRYAARLRRPSGLAGRVVLPLSGGCAREQNGKEMHSALCWRVSVVSNYLPTCYEMHLKTILNHVYAYPGFVYTEFELTSEQSPRLLVRVEPRRRSKPICSGCNQKGPGYDRLEERRFEFIPIWGILVFFLYTMRRVDCRRCGVKVESLPWASGKRPLTNAYAYFLASWAKRMSWAEVAAAFKTSWESVYRSVERVVKWGLEHRPLEGIKAIGVDEVLWRRGHKFLTVVYQIDDGCRRLLWVGQDRTVKTLLRFFRQFGSQRTKQLQFVCSDMWKPFLKVIAKKAAQAVHVLDRFHIMANMNKAIDEVRAKEAKKLKAKGMGEVLKGARWVLLKRPENRTPTQETKLADLVRYNLQAVRSYLLREEFQLFWTFLSSHFAGLFLDRWCTKVMRSRLEPMKKIARSLRAHKPLILNWFRARGLVSTGAVEGLNNKLKVITRRAFGFRTFGAIEIALYHTLGNLPDPSAQLAHRFC
jgi:transposase